MIASPHTISPLLKSRFGNAVAITCGCSADPELPGTLGAGLPQVGPGTAADGAWLWTPPWNSANRSSFPDQPSWASGEAQFTGIEANRGKGLAYTSRTDFHGSHSGSVTPT